MSRVFVHGTGAVSPAGWGVAAVRLALERGKPLDAQPVARPGWTRSLLARSVPRTPVFPSCMSHPRLRRAGPISQHTVAAAMEALGLEHGHGAALPELGVGVGVIVCVMAGGISYSRRFFSEVVENPATASPLLFPETVFNAPASHLSACLGSCAESATIVGDDGAFLQGLAIAAEWLARGTMKRCVVVGAEELDWLTSDAMRVFSRRSVHAEGAGAICLSSDAPACGGAELVMVTDAHTYSREVSRREAAGRMRRQLPEESPGELLILGTQGLAADAAEISAWADWRGARIAPNTILGCAFPASTAWQCVLACDELGAGRYRAANVSAVGVNQQAIGARFLACPPVPHITGSPAEMHGH